MLLKIIICFIKMTEYLCAYILIHLTMKKEMVPIFLDFRLLITHLVS